MKCDICGGEGVLIHKGVRDNLDIDVYECTECKTKFLSDINERDYEHGFMYEKNDISATSIEKLLKQTYPDDNRRWQMCRELLKNKKVLDFGCGFGGFLQIVNTTNDMDDNAHMRGGGWN